MLGDFENFHTIQDAHVACTSNRRIVSHVSRRRGRLEDPGGDVRLPLAVTPGTNGEYIPDPPMAYDLSVESAALARADETARFVGLDRRTFLRSAAGVATVLATIDLAGCSSSGRNASSASTTTNRPPSTTGAGGSFSVPPTTNVAECERALGTQGEFIVDVHTHHVMPDGPWRRNAPETVGLAHAAAFCVCGQISAEDHP
jgi:hypothetical protein